MRIGFCLQLKNMVRFRNKHWFGVGPKIWRPNKIWFDLFLLKVQTVDRTFTPIVCSTPWPIYWKCNLTPWNHKLGCCAIVVGISCFTIFVGVWWDVLMVREKWDLAGENVSHGGVRIVREEAVGCDGRCWDGWWMGGKGFCFFFW